MGFFGQLSCKRHIGYSNARSLLAAITAKGGYMTVAQREEMTRVALAEHKCMQVQVQVWTANFYRGEKEPQEEPDARLHVLKIL